MHDAIHPFDHDEAKFAEFLEENGKTREEFDTEAREDAEKSVRVRLVLDELADDQEVTVSQDELTERIVFQAQQYQMPPEEFVQRIQEAGQLGAIYADVRRSKALIAAVRAATVTDASGTALDMAELLGDDEAGAGRRGPREAAEKSDEESAEKSDDDCGRLSARPQRTRRPTRPVASFRRVGSSSVQTEQTRARGRVK